MPLHFGVNALYLIPGAVGGTEIYLRSLLNALAEIDDSNRYTIFTNAETDADLVPLARNFQQAPQAVAAVKRPARILWEQTRLPADAKRRGVQVMFNPGFTAPLWRCCPNVTVFHDLQYKRHPEYFRWYDLPFWRMLLYGSVHQSRKLIAVSQATADDLQLFYSVGTDRVRVIPHGVDERFFQIGKKRESPEAMLLCVSTLHPHKNLDMLLRAFLPFGHKHPEFTLTIAGLKGFQTAELEKLRAQLNLDKSVRFTGWIPRSQLYDLFARASGFLYPSRFEGFGMPVLEALAAGIPTACSNVEPIKSIAGTAALQFDPASVNEITDAMEQITCNQSLRRRLERDGPVRAACYSWHACARATLEVLCSAV